MIEKLKTINPYDEIEINMDTNSVAGLVYENTPLVQKINELVDVVNKLQLVEDVMFNRIDILNNAICDIRNRISALDDLTYHEAEPEPADPYAEQKKWIGCLCRFWNFEDGTVDMGILKAIDNLKPTIPYINDIDCSYAYCEPVKPDDDIIYHGE